MFISSGEQIRFLLILLLGSQDVPMGESERKLILLLSTVDC